MRWTLGTAVGLYVGVILLLNIPFIQRQISSIVAGELSGLLGSNLTVGRIDMGLLNRIIIEDLLLEDQSGEELAKISRLSARIELSQLLQGKISIANVQLFGFNIALRKEHPDAVPNYQFVLDAFASKDTVQKENNLDLRINSILIRRGKLSYDVASEEETPGLFNANHIRLQNLLANISLKALSKDSLNVAIKRLSLEEANSGFELKRLRMKLLANDRSLCMDNFAVELPRTQLSTDTLRLEYDSFDSFKHLADSVRFSLHLLPSQITLQDLSAFVPAFRNFKEGLQLELETSGTLNQMECPLFSLHNNSEHFRLKADVSLQDLSHFDDALVLGHLSTLYADPEGIAFFVRNLSETAAVPPVLQHLGTVSFQGEVAGSLSDLSTFGELHTDCGTVNMDLKVGKDGAKNPVYEGQVQTDDFALGTLLGDDKIGNTTFNLNIKGTHDGKSHPNVWLQGIVSSINYNDYTYTDIVMDGEYWGGGFLGSIAMNDNNGSIQVNGNFNMAAATPVFNLTATVDSLRLHDLKLTPKYEGNELSLRLRADFTGGSIDEMNGEINIDSLLFVTPQATHFTDNIRLASEWQDSRHKRLTLESQFLKGCIEGDFSYRTLPAGIMNMMHHYLPALVPQDKGKVQQTDNNFSFSLDVYDTDLITALFDLPLKVYTHSTVKGFFNDKARRLRVEGYFPRLRYGNKFIESGMVLCENPEDSFHLKARLTNRKQEGAVNIALDAVARNDSLHTVLDWGNSSTSTYSGKLASVTRFLREQMETGKHVDAAAKRLSGQKHHSPAPLKTVIDIQSTHAILNDTLWEVSPSQIVIDSGKVYVNDFNFRHEERHLHVDGIISNQPQDTLRLDLKCINIGYVFDIADLGVNFQGEATGPAYACSLLKDPVMNADLFIRNFGLNNAPLGNADIHGEWHHDVKGILLDAHIQEKDIAKTYVSGYVYPLKPTSALDLQIKANGTNLQFIHYYMEGITSRFTGRVTGDVHLYGKFKKLTMQGKVDADASFKVDVLNTTYTVKDSILVEPHGLTFRNNRVFDTKGHGGRLDGELRYEHFKNISYNFRFGLNNMLLLDTKESPDFPFYGTVYGTGKATLSGNARDGLYVDVAIATNRNSTFTYIKDYVSSAVSNQFIRFVDKTPRHILPDSLKLSEFEQAQKELEERESDADIRLNLLVDATPEATMRIIMDPVAGDYISAKGSGNIRTEFYNKGDIRLFGSYRVTQGVYKFSLQELIRKDFTIKNGGMVNFGGGLSNATLDLNASYTVNSASLNDLIPNAGNYVDQTNVKVECIMNLSGQLTSPAVKLSLELPNERDEVQALVRNYIPTDEQMNMQILYLLSIGKFYMPENVETQNSNVMSSVLSSTLSGQLNNALSNIINSNNWNIGTNFSTGEKGWTDVEFEGILSGQLLNNRLLINGNFGYRDNPLANTNFVGDFEAEFLLNRSGDIRLKAYNETNDRYYTKTNLTTQGIGLIFKKDFNKWSELLFWNKWKLKRLQKQMEAKSKE